MKTPSTFSAAVTARVISRRLGEIGLPVSHRPKSRWHRASVGLQVHRIGYSCTVAVNYYDPRMVPGHPTPDQREARELALRQARLFLQQWGYSIETPEGWKNALYIRCEGA